MRYHPCYVINDAGDEEFTHKPEPGWQQLQHTVYKRSFITPSFKLERRYYLLASIRAAILAHPVSKPPKGKWKAGFAFNRADISFRNRFNLTCAILQIAPSHEVAWRRAYDGRSSHHVHVQCASLHHQFNPVIASKVGGLWDRGPTLRFIITIQLFDQSGNNI